MNRTEKITLQAKNKHKVLAFKEGFFYKVYNEGAYLLQDKHYKLQSNGKGNLKSLYVGFKEAVIDRLKVECKLEKTNV